LVSTDEDVQTQVVQNSNGSVTKITTTTTKNTFSDGSWATNTKTQTVTESACHQQQQRQIQGSTCPGGKNESGSSSSSEDEASSKPESDNSEFTKFELETLHAHNEYRKKHGAPPMKLSRKVCQFSQNWANNLASSGRMQHSSGSGYGENLYMTSGNVGSGKDAVKAWYDEIHQYNFNNQGFSSGTGHFTQVVWKNSTELGIAKASGRSGTFVVCNYSPPGNYQGQFNQNVARPQ